MDTKTAELRMGTAYMTHELRRGRGALEISLTEDGNIGIFRAGEERCLAKGDTVLDAISHITRILT